MEGKGATLAKRATDFALRVVRLFRALPECDEARVIGSQLLRSATSVATNDRAVSGRGRGLTLFPSWGSWRRKLTRRSGSSSWGRRES